MALARAVAVRPSVLLLDEPLTALDAALRERLRGELDRLLRTLGITTIYVTHDQAEAMALGDRIVVMRKGAIVQIGSPRDVYFAPQSRFVAEFVGAANILEATVEDGYAVLPRRAPAHAEDGAERAGDARWCARKRSQSSTAAERRACRRGRHCQFRRRSPAPHHKRSG